MNAEWNSHYTNDKSKLTYPDENLVRLIKKNYNLYNAENSTALDLGCGTGRHLKLLGECGFKKIIGTDSSFNALTA
jgi:SAM-dependent methyltransferase